ncbi:MAG: lysophospholipid acyltransferase family protein [Spirulinaceae cyanobacterium]
MTTVNPWIYSLILPIHRVFIALYFGQIRIIGEENLPVNGPVVLAPKHYSRYDPLIVSCLSTEPLYYMTHHHEFEESYSWLLERLGAFPVNREKPSISSLRLPIELLQAKKKLVVFPEGGIVRDQPVRKLKSGLARLVMQAETLAQDDLTIPIVPIGLSYKPEAEKGAKVIIKIAPSLLIEEYRQGKDKETASALTQALEAALLANC